MTDSVSLRQLFKESQARLAPLFSSAEDADLRLHKHFDKGTRELGLSEYKQSHEYGALLEGFWSRSRALDALITDSMCELAGNNVKHHALILAYLSVPGRYFRSRYKRAWIWRRLRGANLVRFSDEFLSILREIWFEQIEQAGPEFREIRK